MLSETQSYTCVKIQTDFVEDRSIDFCIWFIYVCWCDYIFPWHNASRERRNGEQRRKGDSGQGGEVRRKKTKWWFNRQEPARHSGKKKKNPKTFERVTEVFLIQISLQDSWVQPPNIATNCIIQLLKNKQALFKILLLLHIISPDMCFCSGSLWLW